MDNAKIRLLHVYRIIERGNKVNAKQIADELWRKYEIRVERKTLYDDIRAIDRVCPVQVSIRPGGGFQKIDWHWGD